MAAPRSTRPRPTRHDLRTDRGVAMPSPVIALSVVAVALAVVAFFLTGGGAEEKREITPAAGNSGSASPSADSSPQGGQKSQKQAKKDKKKNKKPKVDRAGTYVVVFNNTNIAGLAGEAGERARTVGWNVVGVDNWHGTVPDNTVYYPDGMRAAGEQLALDLGIKRTRTAVPGSMSPDRLTVILVGPLS